MKNKIHLVLALLAIAILLIGITAFDKSSTIRMSVMFVGVVTGIAAFIFKLIQMIKR